jgi:hypothetical protein
MKRPGFGGGWGARVSVEVPLRRQGRERLARAEDAGHEHGQSAQGSRDRLVQAPRARDNHGDGEDEDGSTGDLPKGGPAAQRSTGSRSRALARSSSVGRV